MKKLLLLIPGVVFVAVFSTGYSQTASQNQASGSAAQGQPTGSATQDQTSQSAATAAFMKKAEDACNIKPSQAYRLGKHDGEKGVHTHTHALTLCENEAIFPAYNKGFKAGERERARHHKDAMK